MNVYIGNNPGLPKVIYESKGNILLFNIIDEGYNIIERELLNKERRCSVPLLDRGISNIKCPDRLLPKLVGILLIS